MDLQQLAQQLKSLESIKELIATGGATTVAQSHLIAKYLSQGYTLEPWSKVEALASWGVTAEADIEVAFETPNCPLILTELQVDQWLTDNTTSSTMPVNSPLPSCGLYGDGSALKSGLGFQVQMKSDHGAVREFFEGYLICSAFEGDLRNRLPLGVGLEQAKSEITVAVQTLGTRAGSDVYSAQATLRGLKAVK